MNFYIFFLWNNYVTLILSYKTMTCAAGLSVFLLIIISWYVQNICHDTPLLQWYKKFCIAFVTLHFVCDAKVFSCTLSKFTWFANKYPLFDGFNITLFWVSWKYNICYLNLPILILFSNIMVGFLYLLICTNWSNLMTPLKLKLLTKYWSQTDNSHFVPTVKLCYLQSHFSNLKRQGLSIRGHRGYEKEETVIRCLQHSCIGAW